MYYLRGIKLRPGFTLTGYILAPCHNIQANTPVENIPAMYDEAHGYDKF